MKLEGIRGMLEYWEEQVNYSERSLAYSKEQVEHWLGKLSLAVAQDIERDCDGRSS